MDELDGVTVVSATDLVAHLACGHVTWLDMQAANGRIAKPDRNDPMLQLLRERGLDHERAYLAQLAAAGKEVFDVEATRPQPPDSAAGRQRFDRATLLRMGQEKTAKAMSDGVDVVYQATFFDETREPKWRGHADFLRRVDVASDLGAWSYEPEDTKLSRHVKAGAVLQLCAYAEQVARVQGSQPDSVHVVLGDGETVTVPLATVSAYYRAVKGRFVESLASTVEVYPLPTGHCAVCRWAGRCHQQWDEDDHLSRVAFITRENTRRLESAGLATLTALATASDGLEVRGISPMVLDRLRTQARLQHARQPGEPPPWEHVLPIEENMGLAALPVPDSGDLFYDIEGHPYVGVDGIEYLHGVGWEEDGEFAFEGWWAHTPREERQVFERLIDFIVDRRQRHPGLHVFHYAPYETTALGKLMGRYGTREDEVDDLLRQGVFVDLYRVVRQGLRVGTPSYSIKKLEPLYMRPRDGDIGTGGSSIVEYERWLQSGDPQILVDIEAYNRDDVESTWLLRSWLEERRSQLVDGGTAVERPRPPTDAEVPAIDPALGALVGQLERDRTEWLDDVAASASSGAGGSGDLEPPEEAAARWLMADLLQWHQREAKPEWWSYFTRRDTYEADDFVADSETLGGLELVGPVGHVKRSTVWRYRFDPEQEFKFRPGDQPQDPDLLRLERDGADVTGATGRVHDVDPGSGTIDLVRGNGWDGPHPLALMPKGPMSTTPMKESLLRVGDALLQHGIDGAGPARSARQLLARRLPQIDGVQNGAALRAPGETSSAAAVRLVTNLEGSCLAIQGPPGAGKTHTAAAVILELVGQHRRVGITAFTHSAIGTLLGKVIELAEEQGLAPSIVQKVTKDDQGVDHQFVTVMGKPGDVVDAVPGADIVAGTSWLFARDDMEEAVDTLIVDEAGQLSLANVLAVAPACTNLVLVGDPRQLSQPSKGVHPRGAGVSALEHLLGRSATLPPDRGLFLDQSWRMHPEVCGFISEQVYEGRLSSRPQMAGQRVADGPVVSGSGLRWLPVKHEGNRTSSEEEAIALRQVYGALLGRGWVDERGHDQTIGTEDILVVAPYNAQVHQLASVLPGEARIGTVDRFQGQEAAVVLVSMAASSAEDVPRGMEFLYSTNRLNVAVSRARALCVLAASPRLLAVECRTVQQMQLANVLCRYVEMSTPVAATGL